VRITRAVAAAAAIAVAASAAAVAQSSTEFKVGGSVTVTGGTKAKPKPGGLSFKFDVSDPSGNQTPPVQTYTIMYEGGRINTGILPACKADTLNAMSSPDPSSCPTGSKIGSGKLTALIGSAGQPTSTASPCSASLSLYAAGKGHATLFVSSKLGECPVALSQGIDMQYVTKGVLAGLKFTVPDLLRHQVGLDITVTHAEVSLSKIVKTVKGKKVGYVESTGCKDGQRDIVVTFTDETGASFPAQATLGKC
jgi:hypothetical protein